MKIDFNNVKIVSVEDWTTVYKDGKKVWETSDFNAWELIKILELPIETILPDYDWADDYLGENGVFPDDLEEIKK